jgi:hypothetical protein
VLDAAPKPSSRARQGEWAVVGCLLLVAEVVVVMLVVAAVMAMKVFCWQSGGGGSFALAACVFKNFWG